MKSKVCMLTSVHNPFDNRIFHKECKSLLTSGFEVLLIVKYKNEEIVDGIKIIPFPEYKNKYKRVLFAPLKMYLVAIKQRAHIYHFHDPELIITGILLKLSGKRIIYDVHENITEQILNKEWLGKEIVKKLISFLVSIIEGIAVKFFDAIIAATPSIEKKFEKQNVVILRNLPVLRYIDDSGPVEMKKDKVIIVYAGGLTKIRGIKEIIQSMEYVGDKAKLLLLGNWESKEFMDDCQRLKGYRYVEYLGFKKVNEVYSYMKSSDIGIINFLPLPNQIDSMPNKPFEYMACSLPIVMSDFKIWRDIFKECALFSDPTNPRDIAEKLSILIEDKELRKSMGKKGRRLVEKRYTWENESKKLIKLYEKLLH